MKIVRSIALWIVISLAVQTLGLLYLDKKIFANSSNFEAVKVEEPKKEEKKIDVTLGGKQDYKTSFDGKYISYLEDGVINLISSSDGKSSEVENEEGQETLNYKWLSDRNRLLIVERKKTSGKTGNTATLYSYDVKKGEKTKMSELGAVKSGTIAKIDASTLHNVTYVSFKDVNKKSTTYRIDINHHITKPDLLSIDIGSINVLTNEDRLIYDDEANGNVYITTPDKKLQFTSKATLLGADGEDNVYVGLLEKGKVTKVAFGLPKNSVKTWKTINLSTATDSKNIYITESGEIQVDNPLKGVVKNITRSTEVSYEGTLIGFYNNGIMSEQENKLVNTKFDK